MKKKKCNSYLGTLWDRLRFVLWDYLSPDRAPARHRQDPDADRQAVRKDQHGPDLRPCYQVSSWKILAFTKFGLCVSLKWFVLVCRRQSGVKGLYRGLVPPLLGSSVFRSVQFGAYGAALASMRDTPWTQKDIPLTGGLTPKVDRLKFYLTHSRDEGSQL